MNSLATRTLDDERLAEYAEEIAHRTINDLTEIERTVMSDGREYVSEDTPCPERVARLVAVSLGREVTEAKAPAMGPNGAIESRNVPAIDCGDYVVVISEYHAETWDSDSADDIGWPPS